MIDIIFLGTGGGRFATIMQKRATGGFVIIGKGQYHVDPGPGAVVRAWQYGVDPTRTDHILVSHCHPDHYAGVEVLIEAMTGGGYIRSGLLAGSKSAISGYRGMGPAISSYHRSLPLKVMALSPGDEISVPDGMMRVLPTRHSDPTGVGFRFLFENADISYTSDTMLDESVIRSHAGAQILIVNAVVCERFGSEKHMNIEEVMSLISSARPEIALLSHFSALMLSLDPAEIAREIEVETGIRTCAASDGTRINILEDDVRVDST